LHCVMGIMVWNDSLTGVCMILVLHGLSIGVQKLMNGKDL
jgi:hypothetical protein